jgi:competence CoiA-like predicted nuclease
MTLQTLRRSENWSSSSPRWDAGWHAELEVPAASGWWRADVLATSPAGSQRMAWEAQLSSITVVDIRQRTERFVADGVAVCWVTIHRRSWLGEVPSVLR